MNEKKQSNPPILKIGIFFALAVCVLLMLQMNAEKNKESNSKNQHAVRMHSEILELICPADWKAETALDSFRFTHPDGSFIILDAQQDQKFFLSPLDKNPAQNSADLTELISKYNIKSTVEIISTYQDKLAKINALNFNILIENKQKGIAAITYIRDWKITYIASWTGAETEHSAFICKNCKNFISLKQNFSEPNYIRPVIDSSEFVDIYIITTKADNYYKQAKQLLLDAEENSNDIANAVKTYQDALSTLALSKNGGLMYKNTNSLIEDAKIAFQKRNDNFKKMESEVTQYIKTGDNEMANKVLDDMLSTAYLENELTFKEWALNMKANLPKTTNQ